MTARRNLNAAPAESMAAIVAGMKAQTDQVVTRPTGVKDLGESGDVRWARQDGTSISVRDIPAAMETLESELRAGISTVSGMNTVSTDPASGEAAEGAVWTQVQLDAGRLVELARWVMTNGEWAEVGLDASRLVSGSLDVGLIDAVAMAARIVQSGAFVAGEPDGARVEMTGDGIAQWVSGPDGPEPALFIGPRGENLFTAGATTVSGGSVASPLGAFDEVTVGGSSIAELLTQMPRGVVAHFRAERSSAHDATGGMVKRLETQAVLEPARRYSVQVDQHYVTAGDLSSTIHVVQGLYYGYGGVETSSTQIASTRHARAFRGAPLTIPAVIGWIDTSALTEPTEASFLYALAGSSSTTVAAMARWPDYPLNMTVTDMGPASPRSGISWMHLGASGGAEAVAAPKVTRTTSTWGAASFGGDVGSGEVIQGQYGSYGMRSGGWVFYPAMRSALAGSTIEKFEVYLHAAHWAYGAGGTASIRPNTGDYKATPGTATTVESRNWPRNTGRWVTLPTAWYPHFASGTYRGISVQTNNTSLTYYGRFKGSATRFRVTCRK